MPFNSPDPYFWITAVLAALVKVAASDKFHIWRGLISFVIAIFCAWVFTDPFLDWFDLRKEVYQIPVAALFAVTGENMVRMILLTTSDNKVILSIIKAWRGK